MKVKAKQGPWLWPLHEPDTWQKGEFDYLIRRRGGKGGLIRRIHGSHLHLKQLSDVDAEMGENTNINHPHHSDTGATTCFVLAATQQAGVQKGFPMIIFPWAGVGFGEETLPAVGRARTGRVLFLFDNDPSMRQENGPRQTRDGARMVDLWRSAGHPRSRK